jgi:phenylpropionate dioxygenase-like ring-hydroxylating dioxygenase large terminal subunit
MTTVKKATFLSTTYGAYSHRDVPREDEELTHVGPGTPCGEYLRRFWQPLPIMQEPTDLPIRFSLLGEDLVVFRDKSGHVGVLELHCSHRGTSLEFGLVEQNGIRCCYHGWQFDVDGRILDTPGEPPESTYKDRLCHGAYPVREYEGMIFTYMGPPDKMPFFPIFSSFKVKGYHRSMGRRDITPCNWLQVTENALDPTHTAFLHSRSSGGQFMDDDGKAVMEFGEIGELDFMETTAGVVYINTRRIGQDVWVRMGELVHSNMQQTPGHPKFPAEYENGKNEILSGPRFTKWVVPMDDTHTMSILVNHVKDGTAKLSHVNPVLGPSGGNADDRPYEEMQRNPGDYEAEVSQRPIAVHAMERLGFTDRGITIFRKQLRQGIRAVQSGQDPKGVIREDGQITPTFATDTIINIPPAATPAEDKKLLQDTGRRLITSYLETPPHDISP